MLRLSGMGLRMTARHVSLRQRSSVIRRSDLRRRTVALAEACVASALLLGCGAPAPTPPTPAPATRLPATRTSTASATPASNVTATPRPLTILTPAIVLEPPDRPPTQAPEPAPVNLPPEEMTIYLPGPGSQVTTPFRVSGRGGPSWMGRVHLRLYGESGQLLSEGVTYLLANPGRVGRFYGELAFSIPFVAEAGRLEASVDDLRTGRMSHLATVDLILLSAGEPLIHPALDGPEKIAILEPKDGAVVSGGLLAVRGAGWVDSDLPVTISLVDRAGNVLGAAEVPVDAPKVGELGTFEATIAYSVGFSQYARVFITERSPVVSELVHVSSHEIYLQP
jgi:hypothetical protein